MRRERGFTVVELMLALVLVGILSAIAGVVYGEALDNARVTRAIAEIRTLEKEIELHRIDNGVLPGSLLDTGRQNLRDPWGRLYVYVRFGGGGAPGGGGGPQPRKDRFLVPVNTTYDLYSKGKDGASVPPFTAKASRDDVVRAADGAFVGLAADF